MVACQEQPKESATAEQGANPPDTVASAQPYFPVASFLQSEIRYVDSLPVGIMKYHARGRKTDSAYIQLGEFHKIAAEFITPELNDSVFKNHFIESSFLDRSNNNATFFYKAKDPESVVQRIDVITAKGDVYDEVKSIYMEKRVKTGETIINKRLFWKPKRSFQIITISPDASLEGKTDLVKVVWDNRE